MFARTCGFDSRLAHQTGYPKGYPVLLFVDLAEKVKPSDFPMILEDQRVLTHLGIAENERFIMEQNQFVLEESS